jgi:hypothetical protein
METELELTPAQKRKAMEGRVLELAGKAKLGKGENYVREKERNRASKRVRDGLHDKVEERRKQELARVRITSIKKALCVLFLLPGKGPWELSPSTQKTIRRWD